MNDILLDKPKYSSYKYVLTCGIGRCNFLLEPKENEIDFSSIEKHDFLKADYKINKIDILFKKIETNND